MAHQIGPDSPETPRPPLAEDEVRFVGDPVALVVAESRYIAEDACELVVVDYDSCRRSSTTPPPSRPSVLVHERHGTNLIGEMAGPPASALEEVFASAAHVVRETIYQQAHAAVPMETRGIVVDMHSRPARSPSGSATQAPHEVRAFCARLLGIARAPGPGHHDATPAVGSARRSWCSARRCASCWRRRGCRRR